MPGNGRKVGVVVHHVASVCPIEIQAAQTVAAGKAVAGGGARQAVLPSESPGCLFQGRGIRGEIEMQMRLVALLAVVGATGCTADRRSSPTEPIEPASPLSATRSALQYVELVMRKLDRTAPPGYPDEGFSTEGRARLSDDVALVAGVMSTPGATAADYCPPSAAILNRATTTIAYFDVTRKPNPALTDFVRDWETVLTRSQCQA